MGHTDCECVVFIFGDRWPGYWGSECQVPSRRISALIIYFQAFPPATIIFTGIGVLLSVGVLHPSLVRPFDIEGPQAAKDASASRDKLIEMFNRIERFFHRLEIYTNISPTMAMSNMIVEIMVEVLTILGIATKEMKRGRLSELVLQLL